MEITLPHNFTPRDYQLPLYQSLDSGIKRAIIVWHRRSGKDKACFNYLVRRAFQQVGTYFYFLPSYSQAKKVIWDNIDNDGFKMLDHVPDDLIKKKNETELKITLINGSVIQLIAADEFKKSGVGTNPIGVVFSEYSVNEPEAWEYVKPILRVNGGWAIFNFTPRGMNHAYELLDRNRNNDKWFTQILTVKDTGILTEKDIEEERDEGTTQDMIDQEYYCKFIEGATQFFRHVDANIVEDEEPDKTHEHRLGVDLAKYQDWTVIAPFDLNTFEVKRLERFNQQDWTLQKARIEATYERLGHPETIIDSTGVGDPILDDLSARGLRNLVPFKFTEESRKRLLENLQVLLENNKIRIPNDPVLISELKSFQYVQHGRKLRAEVPGGKHDDTVMAVALAVWQIPQKPMAVRANDGLRFLTKPQQSTRVNITSYE